MFKSALVALKPDAAQDYVIARAVAWAGQHHWSLTGCTAIDPHQLSPSEPVPLGGGAFKAELDAERLATARAQALASAQLLCEASAQQDVSCQIVSHDGPVLDVLSRESQRHDVLLVGGACEGPNGEAVLRTLLKSTPRPAIVFPREATADGSIVVACDGSYQAARALAAFVASGIAAGREVHVAAFNDDMKAAAEHCETAVQFLHHHGIETHAHAEAIHASIPSSLLALSNRVSAGLLVMGAFGKSNVREFFLGSVTRQILHALSIPVLIDH